MSWNTGDLARIKPDAFTHPYTELNCQMVELRKRVEGAYRTTSWRVILYGRTRQFDAGTSLTVYEDLLMPVGRENYGRDDDYGS